MNTSGLGKMYRKMEFFLHFSPDCTRKGLTAIMQKEREPRKIYYNSGEVQKIIFGEKNNSTRSAFLGKKDLKEGTEDTESFTKVREGKDYNSFGKTRIIKF